MSVTLPRWLRAFAATMTLFVAGAAAQASAQPPQAKTAQQQAEAQGVYRARVRSAQLEQNAQLAQCGGLDLEENARRAGSAREQFEEARRLDQCRKRADVRYHRAERRLRHQR